MDELYKEIVSFQHRYRDYIDSPSSNVGRALEQEIQRLEDETQVKKNPRSLEDRVKNIIRLLHQAGDSEAMSHPHVDELIERCEEFRRELQKL